MEHWQYTRDNSNNNLNSNNTTNHTNNANTNTDTNYIIPGQIKIEPRHLKVGIKGNPPFLNEAASCV